MRRVVESMFGGEGRIVGRVLEEARCMYVDKIDALREMVSATERWVGLFSLGRWGKIKLYLRAPVLFRFISLAVRLRTEIL